MHIIVVYFEMLLFGKVLFIPVVKHSVRMNEANIYIKTPLNSLSEFIYDCTRSLILNLIQFSNIQGLAETCIPNKTTIKGVPSMAVCACFY